MTAERTQEEGSSGPGTGTHDIDITVNGEHYDVRVPSRRTLLDLLRDELSLTGSKKVCDMGHCGACTVLKNGHPVLSCLSLAVACAGAQITTIEGLAEQGGELTPVQEAFIECDGFQCGFCTPGQIISATALLAQNPNPTDDEIRAYMSGNLCRCGAYSGILEAIKRASQVIREKG